MQKLIAAIVLLSMALFLAPGCSQKNIPEPSVSKTFVLVHGAWQAPWVWQTVQQQLQQAGQRVVLVQLPAHGSDTTSPGNVTIDIYRDKVVQAIEGIKENVVLVGHSMGGVVISDVAEEIPGRIEKLVYVGAFLPANGQSLLDLASTDSQSLLGPSLVPSLDQLTLDVLHPNIVSIFCQDAPVSAQNLMLQNYRAEPAIPFTNKVALTDGHFGSVDKYYIHTLLDHAVGINLQNRMAHSAHITKIFSLNTGHSPFLSQPMELTRLLLTIVQ